MIKLINMFNYKFQFSAKKYSIVFVLSLFLILVLNSKTFSLDRDKAFLKTEGKIIRKDFIIGKGHFKLKDIKYVAQDSIIYDKKNNILHLYGNVKISQNGLTGQANYFKLYLGNNKIRSIQEHSITFE